MGCKNEDVIGTTSKRKREGANTDIYRAHILRSYLQYFGGVSRREKPRVPQKGARTSLCVFLSACSWRVHLFFSYLKQPMGRSTTEVHPNFSEAPRLRISIPHPKIDFSEIQVASRRVTPWPESTKRFLSKSRLAFRRFGVKEPRLSETKSGNVLPLSYNGSNTFEYQ